jgi:hypothetical protein
MSENQPVARMLDFSNVGAPSIFGLLSNIEFSPPPLPTPVEELSEQEITRRRVEEGLPTFALGSVPVTAVRRRPIALAQPSVEAAENHIMVSLRGGRYFVLNRSRSHSEFNPVTIDDFYKTQCASGCVRIYPQLLPKEAEEGGLSVDVIRTSLAVDLPFSKFKDHINTLVSPYQQFKQFNENEMTKKFNIKFGTSSGNKPYLIYLRIWDKFTQIRHQMRRLLNSWLLKKSQKKILPIPNYETMEDPEPNNCIEWTDIENRCTYRIHGDTLVKSIKMYLHHSDYGFPEPLTPKNPTTNAPFTLGQLIHLTYEIYSWCGKNRKAVPYILTKYQEAQFCLSKLVLKNRPEMTLYACRDLFKEIGQPDAIEMWLDMIEEYATIFPSVSRDDLETEIPLWIASLDAIERNDILATWSSILPDLVQLSRFRYFIRSEWTDMTTVKKIVRTLWAKTYHRIRNYVQAKRRSATLAIQQEADAEEQAAEAFASQVLAATNEHILPLPNSSIQQFLATLSTPSFEISSAWITNDVTEVADVAYNMIMFPAEPAADNSLQDVD